MFMNMVMILGSKGWGLGFDKEESKKALLRTHTTVNTVQHIANNPDKQAEYLE